jgi:hypothetical protein
MHIYYSKGDDSMAAITKINSAVVIKYQDGVNEKGEDIIRSKKFSNLKLTASEDGIYNTAREMEKLLGKPLTEIIKTDNSDITNA